VERADGAGRNSFARNTGDATLPVMKPILNTEEKIGKTVGRRVAPRDAFRFGMGMQKTAIELERAMRRSLCPKGVFRFHTHEEQASTRPCSSPEIERYR